MTVVVNITSTLNGGTLTVKVYEDTDGDGTADNTESQSTSTDGASLIFDTLAGGSGNDYWIEVTLSGGDITSTPLVESVALDANPSVSGKLEYTASIPSGDGISVTVNEDTDGDGSADNSETVPIEDGQGSIDLYIIEGGAGNDYWLDVSMSSGVESTPSADVLTVSPNLSGQRASRVGLNAAEGNTGRGRAAPGNTANNEVTEQ